MILTFLLGFLCWLFRAPKAEREVYEPNSRISLYINLLYILINHLCSIFVAVF